MSRYDFSLDFSASEAADKNEASKKRKSRWGQENIIQCLEGFSISEKSSSILVKKFEAPQVPKGFVPKGVKGKKSRFKFTTYILKISRNEREMKKKSVRFDDIFLKIKYFSTHRKIPEIIFSHFNFTRFFGNYTFSTC